MAGRIKHMAKNLYRNTGILTVCMAALGLLLTACGASAGGAGENGWEASDTGKASGGDGIGGEAKSAQPEEEAKEWPGEQDSCKVQELGGYLYGHVSASPYASAEIMIKGYEGEALESDWDAPSAFRFAGEAEVTWRFYSSLAEMETALNEVSRREAEGASLRFLYYTFPMTENVHALDLYHDLKRRFDTEEHPLTVWSMDNGKLLCFLQETLKMEDGYELIYLRHQSSKVNLYVKDRTAYGLTLLDAPSEEDETLEYVFTDIFQSYGSLGSGWGLDEETLYWIDHDERLTELEDPKRSFLEVRGIDENWEYAGDEGVMRYFGLLVEADYELALTEGGRMLSLHFSLSEEEGQEEDSVSDYIYDFRKDAIISAIGSLAESGDGASAEEKETAAKEDAEPRYYLV